MFQHLTESWSWVQSCTSNPPLHHLLMSGYFSQTSNLLVIELNSRRLLLMCDTGMRVLLWRARSKYRCGLGGGSQLLFLLRLWQKIGIS